MTMTEKAAKLGISQYYLAMIYNGRRRPGYSLVKRLQDLIGKKYTMEFWQTAKVSEIQKAINSIR